MIHNENSHEAYMREALQLARLAEGRTSPNPMVGAVIVRDGRIIGRGYHKAAGQPHAEVEAIRNALACGEDCRDARMYVTLEPCCHHGRTPPCTQAILAAGLAEVVYACGDPNPKVSGGGKSQLEEAGIQVAHGLLAKEAYDLNRSFFHYIRTGRPYVIVKYAMTLDGKIATHSGASQWITEAPAREIVHQLRNRCDAIMVGTRTVLADDPSLTTRLPEGSDIRHPIRIIPDRQHRIPLSARVLAGTLPGRTMVFAATPPPQVRADHFRTHHIEFRPTILDEAGLLDVDHMLSTLAKEHITTLMVEGGSVLLGRLLAQHRINELWTFVGAKIVGGLQAPGPFGNPGFSQLEEGPHLHIQQVRQLGNDLLIQSRVISP